MGRSVEWWWWWGWVEELDCEAREEEVGEREDWCADARVGKDELPPMSLLKLPSEPS